MNCTNCGAPVDLVEGRGYFICGYCSTLRFPETDEQQASKDGVTPLGEETDWDCPLCDQSLEHATLDDIRIHYCDDCRGSLVDCEAFAAVVNQRRSQFSEADRTPLPLDPVQFERKIRCPICQGPMDVHPYYGPGNAVIDSCYRCRVVWLDHCEIAAIEAAPGRR